MLHDALISGREGAGTDRRRDTRTTIKGEMVVQWHHDPGTSVRYRILDLSDGGARVLSSIPMVKGLSGTAVRLLPIGTTLHRMCTVTWVRPSRIDGVFEIGLRFT
jgi:hypothetical protein